MIALTRLALADERQRELVGLTPLYQKVDLTESNLGRSD